MRWSPATRRPRRDPRKSQLGYPSGGPALLDQEGRVLPSRHELALPPVHEDQNRLGLARRLLRLTLGLLRRRRGLLLAHRFVSVSGRTRGRVVGAAGGEPAVRLVPLADRRITLG